MSPRDSATSDDYVVIFERLIEAPREIVWKAWTDAESVRQWWGPPGCVNSECEIDLRVGGMFRLTMHTPDGNAYPCVGRFREIAPPVRLVLQGEDDAGHPCGAGLPPGALVILTLEEAGKGTALRLKTRFETDAARRAANESGYSTSWPPCLDRMSDFVARGA